MKNSNKRELTIHHNMPYYNGDDDGILESFTEKVYDTPDDKYKIRLIQNPKIVYDAMDILIKSKSKRGIKAWFKKATCDHNWLLIANTHGDIINHSKGRTLIICANCGDWMWLSRYIPAPLSYTYNGFRRKS